jgi:hypothetical protein
MSSKKDSKVSFESQTLNCTGCKEPVKNVDKNAVAVLCWKCSTKMPVGYKQEKIKK